jgi:hypothetical protein
MPVLAKAIFVGLSIWFGGHIVQSARGGFYLYDTRVEGCHVRFQERGQWQGAKWLRQTNEVFCFHYASEVK